MKTGLVLEGGAMRGMYTGGVQDVFMENGIEVDGIVGVSAGALFGCNYKSRQIGRPLRYNLNYGRDPRYTGLKSLLTTGDLYNADFCYRVLPEILDPFDRETYIAHPAEFICVCTDVETGKPHYQVCNEGDEKDIQWMRASGSMPVVSNVVEIDGRGYLDGGISDPIPITFMRRRGYKKNIVVLTQNAGYRKKKSSMQPMMDLLLRKYPNLAKAMRHRYLRYNSSLDKIERLEKAGEIFVFRPSKPFDIKRTEADPEKLQNLYDMGRADALERLEELREFLKD